MMKTLFIVTLVIVVFFVRGCIIIHLLCKYNTYVAEFISSKLNKIFPPAKIEDGSCIWVMKCIDYIFGIVLFVLLGSFIYVKCFNGVEFYGDKVTISDRITYMMALGACSFALRIAGKHWRSAIWYLMLGGLANHSDFSEAREQFINLGLDAKVNN